MNRSLHIFALGVLLALLGLSSAGAAPLADTSDRSDALGAPVLAGDSAIYAQSISPAIRVFRFQPGSASSEIASYVIDNDGAYAGVTAGGGNVLMALASIGICGGPEGQQLDDLGIEYPPEVDCIQSSRFFSGAFGAIGRSTGCLNDTTERSFLGFQRLQAGVSGTYLVRPLGGPSVCNRQSRLSARNLATGVEWKLPISADTVVAVSVEGSRLAVTQSVDDTRFALTYFDLAADTFVYRREFSTRNAFTQGLDVQSNGRVALIADVTRSPKSSKPLCRKRHALMTISTRGRIACQPASPKGFGVRLAEDMLTYYEQRGRLVTKQVSSPTRHVLRSSADPDHEPFDFDGSRLTWFEVGCRGTEIRLETLAPGAHFAPVRCPVDIPGKSVEISKNKVIELPLTCANGCKGELLASGPAALMPANRTFGHRIDRDWNPSDQPPGTTRLRFRLHEDFVAYFRKHHPSKIRLTWSSLAGTITGSSQKKSFWVNVSYR